MTEVNSYKMLCFSCEDNNTTDSFSANVKLKPQRHFHSDTWDKVWCVILDIWLMRVCKTSNFDSRFWTIFNKFLGKVFDISKIYVLIFKQWILRNIYKIQIHKDAVWVWKGEFYSIVSVFQRKILWLSVKNKAQAKLTIKQHISKQ